MIWLLACSSSKPETPPAPEAPIALEAEDGFPGDIPSYEPTFGDRVEREALYVVAPFKGGKDLQAVQLILDDGSHWIRSYRPLESELQFIDKRVVVVGRTYTNSPYVQSVGGTHFEVETIALAPGEAAWDPVPTELPAPPQVRTLAELEARHPMWVHAIGTLSAATDEGHGHAAVLTLDEGAEVPFMLFAPTSFEERDQDPQAWIGRRVTVLARVYRDEGLKLGHGKVCEGEVAACQMTLDNSR